MQERHLNRKRYFEEQIHTTRKYYLPYITTTIGGFPDKVLEIGCGEGGNLMPFAEAGCEVVGVDMATSRIAEANLFFQEYQPKGGATFIASDIFKLETFHRKFPLIFIHDVIEHIDSKEQFLHNIQDFLAPGGYIFMAFPAWQMPFGGHQQIARSRFISHCPFIHLLPARFYAYILRSFGEDNRCIEELLSIKSTRTPIELFERTLNRTGYKIVSKQFYFINPHYEIKFGLKPRKLWSAIARIPYMRNFFSTSCFYIIQVSQTKLEK